jgi:hypothetical protein
VTHLTSNPVAGIGVAPQVVSAAVVGARVAVTFSELMQADAALLNAANYTITADVGSAARSVTGVAVAGTAPSNTVLLTLDGALTAGDDNYNVAVANVVDLAGNAIDPAADDADFDGRAALPAVEDWCDLGTSWLLAQFADQPRFRALMCLLLDQVQTLEQLAADMRDLRALDTARGAQLDEWGVRLGYQRNPSSLTDAVYRSALQALALARIAACSADNMISVAQLVSGVSPANLRYVPDYPAALRIFADVPVTYETGRRTAEITRVAKPAAVRFDFSYVPSGFDILSFSDDVVHPAVPFAERGVPSNIRMAERDSGRR